MVYTETTVVYFDIKSKQQIQSVGQNVELKILNLVVPEKNLSLNIKFEHNNLKHTAV